MAWSRPVQYKRSKNRRFGAVYRKAISWHLEWTAVLSALCEYATYAVEVSYRRFVPRAMGLLWADRGHPKFSLGILAS
jgi:hypothetical protein